jgi:DNA repair photolyase
MDQTLTSLTIHGRGAADNPAGRFEPIDYAPDEETGPLDPGRPTTVYLKDASRTIISHNDSPDVGFEYSINAYRGCEHGCIYCYARPTHEWLGFSAGLDFETKIFVKERAPQLLREALAKPAWQPQTISMSGITDCYQPIVRKLKITRGCLQVLADCRHPVAIVTKNHLVTRDIDLLGELARFNAARVLVSITSLRPEVQRIMEPRTSVPRDRLKALEELSAAGISTGVMVAPVIPGLTDHEMPAILQAARDAGASMAAFTAVRLPYGVKDIFCDRLTRQFPDRRDKVLNRIRQMRDGKLNNSQFGSRMRGQGLFAEQLRALFKLARRKAGFGPPGEPLSSAHFRRPMIAGQMRLFE